LTDFDFYGATAPQQPATEMSIALGRFDFRRPESGMGGLQKPSGMKAMDRIHPTSNPLNSSSPASDRRFGLTGVDAAFAFTWLSAPKCQVSVLDFGDHGLCLNG
jgi:hypothetical protein